MLPTFTFLESTTHVGKKNPQKFMPPRLRSSARSSSLECHPVDLEKRWGLATSENPRGENRKKSRKVSMLVGGFNPSHLKNISQIGSFLQVGVKIENLWNHHPVL